MNYILNHKNKEVLNFSIDKDGIILAINEIYNESHAPIGVLSNYKDEPLMALRKWWNSRAIPISRQNIKEALNFLSLSTPLELLTKSFGLSLSDHYWIKPENGNKSTIEWEKINFFTNPFSEDIGKLLFDEHNIDNLPSINFESPENTSDGWLKKRWIITNRTRILLKGGSYPYRQEPFNEVFTSYIYKKLNLPCVNYSLVSYKSDILSACPDMINTNNELIPAWNLINSVKKENSTSNFQHLINCCEYYGIKNLNEVKNQIANMFAYDFIIANTDRHYSNFGFLRNPDTLEWIGLAPSYDNGTSIFCMISEYDLLNKPYFTDSRNINAKPFASNQTQQIKSIFSIHNCKELDFNKLVGIGELYTDLLLKKSSISPERCKCLGKILDERTIEIQTIRNKYINNQITKKKNFQSDLSDYDICQ